MMFAFTESVTIQAPPATVWDRLCDLEDWWSPSNPEHESLEHLDDRGIEPSARLRIHGVTHTTLQVGHAGPAALPDPGYPADTHHGDTHGPSHRPA